MQLIRRPELTYHRPTRPELLIKRNNKAGSFNSSHIVQKIMNDIINWTFYFSHLTVNEKGLIIEYRCITKDIP